MLEIARGRTWTEYFTFHDSDGGPVSDLTEIIEVRCQIRAKTAVRVDGVFNHRLIVNVVASLQGETNSVLKLMLSRTQTAALEIGDYLIDVLGFDGDGRDIPLLFPMPIRAVDRPTAVTAGIPDPGEVPLIPDFSDEFETALTD